MTTSLGRYQVIDAQKKTAKLVSVKNKKATKMNIPNTVKINGVTCTVAEVGAKIMKGNTKLTKVTLGKNVTTIGKQAFYGCKKLKTITIKSKVFKKVGSKAFKGIHEKAKIKVPKAKLSKYKKVLKGKGQVKSVKITA